VIQNNDRETLKNDVGVKNQQSLKSRGKGRIIGGNEIEAHSQPWLALLCLTTTSNQIWCGCGGSLISPTIVLTAAHCDSWALKGDPNRFHYVILGAHSKKQEHFLGTEKIVNIQQWIHHPQCSPKTSNDWDFSMLLLNETVIMTDYIRPILLPSKKDQDYEGKYLYTSGWGATKMIITDGCIKSAGLSDVPKQAIVEVLPHDATACITKGFDYYMCQYCAHEAAICTYGVEKFNSTVVEDACQGDSGGPLFLADRYNAPTLIGVVSWGNKCGLVMSPAVFSKVDHVLDWIRGEMQKYQ